MHDTDAMKKLQVGDLLLEINRSTVVGLVSFQLEMENVRNAGHKQVKLVIQRNVQKVAIEVQTTELSLFGTRRFVYFCGLLIKDTFPSVFYANNCPEEITQHGGAFVIIYRRGKDCNKKLCI